MELSRRGFLGAMLAVAAAPAIVKASSLMPIYVPKPAILTLWGDGVHDDTLALQALIDGKDVVRHDGATFMRHPDGSIYLASGTFAISSAIVFSGNNNRVENVHFEGSRIQQGNMLKWELPTRAPVRQMAHGYYWGEA